VHDLTNTAVGSGHAGMLDAAIRRTLTVRSASSPGHWVIRIPQIKRVATVELSSAWLSISVSLRRLSGPVNLNIIGEMLSRNTRIDDSPRLVAQRQQGKRQIVVEIPVEMLPWDDEVELDVLLGSTITGLKAALKKKHLPSRKTGPVLPLKQVAADFDEAGWPSQPGKAAGLEVPLEVPGHYFVGVVKDDSRSTGLTVPILKSEFATASPDCRSAVTLLLWLNSSRTRMVKATRSRRGWALEVALPAAQCNAIGLRHACAALCAALQQCVAEAACLIADRDLARVYLSTLGFSSSVLRCQPLLPVPISRLTTA